MDTDLNQSGLSLETRLLEGDIKEQKKVGSGYFEAACTLSILLFLGMAVILALTLMDIDKCETHQSPHCPYFTNPQSEQAATAATNPDGSAVGKNNLANFYTYAILPNGNGVKINPDPYPKS